MRTFKYELIHESRRFGATTYHFETLEDILTTEGGTNSFIEYPPSKEDQKLLDFFNIELEKKDIVWINEIEPLDFKLYTW